LLAAMAAPVAAQEDQEDNPYRPGLVAAYSAGQASASRIDEVIAFDWQDASADPRLPAGPFSGVWRGRLWTQSPGRHTLACYVLGQVELKLGGRVVLAGQADQPQWIVSQPLELPFDRHPIEITFRKTGSRAQLAIFWSGPDFGLEPIPARFLMHDRGASPSMAFERGRQLASALRCAACHKDEGASVVAAPALDRLTGNIHESWLVNWLSELEIVPGDKQPRKMPHMGMSRDEATAIAAWLLREPVVRVEPKPIEQKEAKETKERKANQRKSKKAKGDGEKGEEKPEPSAKEGERLLLTRGCLGCHELGTVGETGLFGGGALTTIIFKRPVDFLVRWLQDPAAINRTHRMPVFSFTSDELQSLRLWEDERWKLSSPSRHEVSDRNALVRTGERLVAEFRCANCHLVARDKQELAVGNQPPLSATSDWTRSCAGEPDRTKQRPGYHLTSADQAALKEYYSQSRPGEEKLSPQSRGRDLLVQLNCLGCHQREGVDRSAAAALRLPPISGLLAGLRRERSPTASLPDELVAVAADHEELAPLVPSMTPPALNSVGDKLHDAALSESIRRQGSPHRPYLLVQMPKFNLSDAQLADITAYFTATDRIPGGAGFQPARSVTADETSTPRLAAAGPRLVTADGLSCTSCHQVGSVLPVKAPLNALGPDISMLEKRIRREWFDRWCANPARIVPRMEMPAVKVPVRGVLNEKIEDQLASVWHILNTPGFQPPEPNPVRVLRLSGIPERNERPIVIHDVFKDGDKTYLYPLVIGLPNRHNVLFDLETNHLAAWWLGDTARQRTRGKSWFWEMGAKPILETGINGTEVTVWINGKERLPEAKTQFLTDLDRYGKGSFAKYGSASFQGRMLIPTTDSPISKDGPSAEVRLIEEFVGYQKGFTRTITLEGKGIIDQVRLRLVSPELAKECKWDEHNYSLALPGTSGLVIYVEPAGKASWNHDGSISNRGQAIKYDRERSPKVPLWRTTFQLSYSAALPVDQFLAEVPPIVSVEAIRLEVAPGFSATRLPFSGEIMPSGFCWTPKGELVFTTLKGEVFRAIDLDADGREETVRLLADGLATPYGAVAKEEYVDISAKDGLLRLFDFGNEGRAEHIARVAFGWGCTDDYHDWAVGPVLGEDNEYYFALPCQQDPRSDQAATYRGRIIRVRPQYLFARERPVDIWQVSAGHRFPMGMAMNREGELFVTDNQGNYNPFNELNHVRKGAHFGFINALEKQKGYQPPRHDEPAINIPHPWTRSVNGICFLDTPAPLAGTKPGPGAPGAGLLPAKSIYGPLEGHLIGCEYDTRRLIRMTLQRIGDTYQGAAYPLSIPPADVEKGLLGPIVCAIKPTTGELYVGEIHDSGWGAGNNIGQIVKIKIEPEKLPCGIAEVRATSTGFTIDFFQPVDRVTAADLESYSISSYRRESTPAYGGPDLDRRIEKLVAVEVSTDGKRATINLPELRPGHVYEFHLKNLAPGGAMFHPDEAHYTLRQIPQ
jgi:mono/diheme cytochrome c family protein